MREYADDTTYYMLSAVSRTRGVTLALPAHFLKHMDCRRCQSEDLAELTCQKVHRGAKDVICNTPAKLRKAIEIIEGADQADKFVVCCSYKESTEVAAKAFKRIKSVGPDQVEIVLHDDAGARAEKFQAFQSPGGKRILCMDAKGNSDGLNLYAANNLILLDTPESFEVEEQLVGRLYRIGQTRPVTIHTIVVDDTIESRHADQRAGWREAKTKGVSIDADLDSASGGADATTYRTLKWLITGKKGN